MKRSHTCAHYNSMLIALLHRWSPRCSFYRLSWFQPIEIKHKEMSWESSCEINPHNCKATVKLCSAVMSMIYGGYII